MDNAGVRPYRTDTMVEKWDGDIDPDSNPPTEVITSSAWFENDGTSVTDSVRISEIETDIAARAAEQE